MLVQRLFLLFSLIVSFDCLAAMEMNPIAELNTSSKAIEQRIFKFPRPYGGIISHRGVPLRSPENTLSSFKTAAEEGTSCIEFDLRLSKDLKMVIIHDDTLDRTTDKQGLVNQFKQSDLRGLNAGNGEPIPTIEEVIAIAKERNLTVNIEIKDKKQSGLILTKVLADFINKQWPEKLPLPLVSSFDYENLKLMRQLSKHVPLGYLTDKPNEYIINLVKMTDNAALIVAHKAVTEDEINNLMQQPFPVLFYTVNDLKQAKALLTAGSFAIFTDDTRTMLKALN